MDIYAQAVRPDNQDEPAIEISEWRWEPVLSIMAIANETHFRRTGELLFRRDLTDDLEGQFGYGIQDGDTCRTLATEMTRLANNPMELEDYGMQVQIQDGSYVYTFPVDGCSPDGSFEDKETGVLMRDGEIDPDVVRSCYWISEASLKEVIGFFQQCNGFGLPY